MSKDTGKTEPNVVVGTTADPKSNPVKESDLEAESEMEVVAPIVSGPAAGREVSYVYNVTQPTASTLDTSIRPNPGFDDATVGVPSVSSTVSSIDTKDTTASEVQLRKTSSELYKHELDKIAADAEMTNKGKKAKLDEYCTQFRLVENDDPAMKSLFPPNGRQWFGVDGSAEQNLQCILDRKDRAVVISDASLLSATDFGLDPNRRLFGNRRNTFYLGHYKSQVALVKKVMPKTKPKPPNASSSSKSGAEASFTVHEPLWVSIAKHISRTQHLQYTTSECQTRNTKANAPPETSSEASVGSSVSTSVNSKDPSTVTTRLTTTTTATAATRPFIQVFEVFLLTSDRSLLVFLELAPNKTLHYHVKRRTPVHIQQARRWSAQVLDGVRFLAGHSVVHRSLRLEHLVLDSSRNVRIIGWRRAKPLVPGQLLNRERRTRAHNHLPPEAFSGPFPADWVDQWSWAVALCALSTFRYPFNVRAQLTQSVEEQWTAFKGRHPSSVHSQVAAVLDRVFLSEPDRRATLEAIQACAFYTAVDGSASVDRVNPSAANHDQPPTRVSSSLCKVIKLGSNTSTVPK